MKITKPGYPGLSALVALNVAVVAATVWVAASGMGTVGFEMSPLEPIALMLAVDGFLLAPIWFERRSARKAREAELLVRHLASFRGCMERVEAMARSGPAGADRRDVLGLLREGSNSLHAFGALAGRLDRQELANNGRTLAGSFRAYRDAVSGGRFPFGDPLSPTERSREQRKRLEIVLAVDALEVACW
ncbi:MAG: hypothetical protein Q8P18_20500 [Pseudomonadota bacterium]|nr:hypothetical protein [Pseudomonadota bacterium]